MSGIYLVVWDNENKQLSHVLEPTKGGWPHITVAHTGNLLTKDVLLVLAADIFKEWALKPVTLAHARVNSFMDSSGNMRHDILMDLSTTDSEAIEKTRRSHFSEVDTERFSMQPPHVTYESCVSQIAAEMIAHELNDRLPYQVVVTGVAIK